MLQNKIDFHDNKPIKKIYNDIVWSYSELKNYKEALKYQLMIDSITYMKTEPTNFIDTISWLDSNEDIQTSEAYNLKEAYKKQEQTI
ncbi:MAG: hypothetical protein IPJ74_08645 [Saprospiraceae bacterium]|nr:hypothetical protein [Saprospiraceae bacterium]